GARQRRAARDGRARARRARRTSRRGASPALRPAAAHARLLPGDESDSDQGRDGPPRTLRRRAAAASPADDRRAARSPAPRPGELWTFARRAPPVSIAGEVGVVIGGAAGRMGRMLLSQALDHPALRLVGALEAPGHPSLGTDAGSLIGRAR